MNEIMSVNEPLQEEVEIITERIKEEFEHMYSLLYNEISRYRVGTIIKNQCVLYYDDFDELRSNVVFFRSILVIFHVLYVGNEYDYDIFIKKNLSCSYNLNDDEITLNVPVVYYKDKLTIGIDNSMGDLSHELHHCFQKNRNGIYLSELYKFAYNYCYKDIKFNTFIKFSSDEFPELFGLTYDDVSWILEPLYLLDKREVDANVQKMYTDGLKFCNVTDFEADSDDMYKMYTFLRSSLYPYVKLDEMIKNIKSGTIKYKNDKRVDCFIRMLSNRPAIDGIDGFIKYIDNYISYAQKKFDKCLWFLITQTYVDRSIIETECSFMLGDKIFECSEIYGRKYEELKKDQLERAEYIKNICI